MSSEQVGQQCPRNTGDNMSAIEDKVCEKIQQRAEVGKAKYGITMEEEVLAIREWLNHLQQELMDACVYLEKVLGLVE